MFHLTAREQLLVAGIVAAALLGAAVKHWRDARRLAAPPPALSAPMHSVP